MTIKEDPIQLALERRRVALVGLEGDLRLQQQIKVHIDRIIDTLFRRHGTLFFIGNGGSAATAMHAATEYVVRFAKDRMPLPAVALLDPTLLTAAANDYDFDFVFARQVAARMKPRDLLIAHSTSGRSPNILEALEAARVIGAKANLMTGLRDLPPYPANVHVVTVPARAADVQQELHLMIEHLAAERAEDRLLAAGGARHEREAVHE